MKRTVITLTSAFDGGDTYRSNLIRDLCYIDPSEWSPREKKLMEEASDNGETYHTTVEYTATFMIIETDLGDPDCFVKVYVPISINEKKALECVQLLAEGLSS